MAIARGRERDDSATPHSAPQLDDRHRLVVQLALDGYATDEIARHLNMSKPSVTTLLFQAIRHIHGTQQH